MQSGEERKEMRKKKKKTNEAKVEARDIWVFFLNPLNTRMI